VPVHIVPNLLPRSDFVVGNRVSVVESDFYTKLKKLDLQEGKNKRLFVDHLTQVCEAHDRVILTLLQQVQRLAGPTTEDLLKFSRRSSCSTRTADDDAFVLLIYFCLFCLRKPLVPVC